jgi:hypothetical protein
LFAFSFSCETSNTKSAWFSLHILLYISVSSYIPQDNQIFNLFYFLLFIFCFITNKKNNHHHYQIPFSSLVFILCFLCCQAKKAKLYLQLNLIFSYTFFASCKLFLFLFTSSLFLVSFCVLVMFQCLLTST